MSADIEKPHTTEEKPEVHAPFSRYLEKFEQLYVKEVRKLPPALRSVVLIAGAGITAHPLIAWAKAGWITYVSLDLLLLSLALVILWWDRNVTRERKE